MNGDGCVWVPGVGRYGVGLMDTSWIDPFFGPDGFKVGSTEKYLWRVSRRHHRDRAGRDLLGTIETGRPTSNVAWRRRPHVVCDRRDVGLSNQTHDERRRILMPSGANEVRHRKAQLQPARLDADRSPHPAGEYGRESTKKRQSAMPTIAVRYSGSRARIQSPLHATNRRAQ